MSDLYPLLLIPIFDERPWGVRDLRPIYTKVVKEPIGESWLTWSENRIANVRWDFMAGDNTVSSPFPESFTLADLIRVSKGHISNSCTHYFTATITATFEGQTAQWRPLYFTECANGSMEALDLVMKDAVPHFWSADVYPYALLMAEGIRGRRQAAQEWLKAHASASCTGKQVCYENGAWVVPEENIPALYVPLPHSSIKPPNSEDGLTCADSEQDKLRAQASTGQILTP